MSPCIFKLVIYLGDVDERSRWKIVNEAHTDSIHGANSFDKKADINESG